MCCKHIKQRFDVLAKTRRSERVGCSAKTHRSEWVGCSIDTWHGYGGRSPRYRVATCVYMYIYVHLLKFSLKFHDCKSLRFTEFLLLPHINAFITFSYSGLFFYIVLRFYALLCSLIPRGSFIHCEKKISTYDKYRGQNRGK